MLDYLEQAKKEIRENWFANHMIKSNEGNEGFQRISWGKEGTRMYQVDYVLSGNMVFITGDLGDAAYSLTCRATLKNIEDFNLSYFTGKLSAHQRDRWDFDDKLAREQIKSYFLDWCDVDSVAEMDVDDKELMDELISATKEWGDYKTYEAMGVWTTYNDTDLDWFDSEMASCIADCGKRLSYSIISYWVGLQMVIEQLSQKNDEIAAN